MSDHLSNKMDDHFLAVKIRNFTCHEWPLQIKIADRFTHVLNLIDDLSSAEDQCPLLPNLIGTADLIWSIIIKFRDLSLLFESMPLHNHSNCLGKENTGNKKNYALTTSIQFWSLPCSYTYTAVNFFLNKLGNWSSSCWPISFHLIGRWT